MIEHILLGFLMYTPMSGYEIKQMMKISTANFYEAGYGSIYPALRRMEEKKLISAHETTQGGKYKKVYAINDAGKAIFLDWLQNPIELDRIRPDHLVKIFFFRFLEKDKAIALLREFIGRIQKAEQEFEKLDDRIRPHADFFQYATLRYGRSHISHMIDWYQRLIDDIQNIQQPGGIS